MNETAPDMDQNDSIHVLCAFTPFRREFTPLRHLTAVIPDVTISDGGIC